MYLLIQAGPSDIKTKLALENAVEFTEENWLETNSLLVGAALQPLDHHTAPSAQCVKDAARHGQRPLVLDTLGWWY